MKLFSWCLLVPSIAAEIFPDKAKTYIQGIIYGGTGCRQGTVSSSISPDLNSFTIILDEFIVSTGPGMTERDTRKNCQINVDLQYPLGWSYSIVSVDYRGFVSLPQNFSAIQTSTYYFSGSVEEISYSTIYSGPFEGDYLKRDELLKDPTVWSPCGQVIQNNINTKVIITGDITLSSIMTVDSIDGKISQIYSIKWRKC